ncbi:MAG TPA: LamG-like jellyroll fold domain-containing protein, partial [candidate division Zixibacteria bacterium]|nr:LamG-like jellyroll fold domain-containing protein [candidate division Zixibacteria bacterium]
PDNDPETLYLGLKSGSSSVVTGEYSGDIADVNQPQWHRLIVPLADFSAGGVDLTDVQEIYIGAGNRTSPSAGGTGTLYIDTIRLYPSRTLSDLTGLEMDWNEDGKVDAKELKVFAGEWSLQDKLAKPSTGLWLKLDDTNQEVVDGKVLIEDSSEWDNEASISRYDGSAPTSVTWAEGACLSEAGPGALDLGTTGNVISVTNLPDTLKSAEAMTITFWWYNYADSGVYNQGCWVEGLPGGHPNDEGWSVWAIDYEGGDCIRIWDAYDDNMWCGGDFNQDDLKNQWTHMAFVLSPKETAVYINGELSGTGDPFGSRSGWQNEEGPGADLNTIRFGVHTKWGDGADRTLNDAMLDDIRVYDNELNEASIGSLMNCGEGSIDSFYVPLESIANVVPKVGDEGIFNPENVDAVDFLDFAKFAESWRASSPPWPY